MDRLFVDRPNGKNSLIETEPFDEALDRRIWSLASTRLQWHKRISEVRRTIPNEIKTSVSKFHEQHNTIDEARLPPHTGDLSDPPEEDGAFTINEASPRQSPDLLLANQRERIQESIQTGSALVNELGQVRCKLLTLDARLIHNFCRSLSNNEQEGKESKLFPRTWRH